MMDLCTRMMVQTQQVLQRMAQDKEDEKKQRRRDEEYRVQQDKLKLEMEERIELDRMEKRRLAREAQDRLEALRMEETRAMRNAQERLEEQRLANLQLRREAEENTATVSDDGEKRSPRIPGHVRRYREEEGDSTGGMVPDAHPPTEREVPGNCSETTPRDEGGL